MGFRFFLCSIGGRYDSDFYVSRRTPQSLTGRGIASAQQAFDAGPSSERTYNGLTQYAIWFPIRRLGWSYNSETTYRIRHADK